MSLPLICVLKSLLGVIRKFLYDLQFDITILCTEFLCCGCRIQSAKLFSFNNKIVGCVLLKLYVLELVMYIDWLCTVNTLKQISLKDQHVHINV